MNTDSPVYSLIFVTLTALVCSTVVAAAVTLLRPMQAAQVRIDRNRAIVQASQRTAEQLTDTDVVSRYLDLDAQVIELSSGTHLDNIDATNFDHWERASETTTTANGPADSLVPIYAVKTNGQLDRLILPIDGPGMWSTLYAYVALEPDLVTIASLVVFKHGETAGIGDRIEDADWLLSWRGKRVVDDQGASSIKVVKNPRGAHQIDVISGASVTSIALGDAVNVWFSDAGYAPLLRRLKKDEQPQ